MALFRRRDKVIDLTEKYRKQQERVGQDEGESSKSSQSSEQPASIFPFFTPASSSSETDSEPEDKEYLDISAGVNDKRKKLAKRLMDMTEKIEDLSNQIYHLQQRIEVLERKSGSGY